MTHPLTTREVWTLLLAMGGLLAANGAWLWAMLRLRAAHRRLIAIDHDVRAYLDVAGVLIVGLDPAGRIILLNRRAREVLELEEDEGIGEPWFERFTPPEMRERLTSDFESFLSGGATSMSTEYEVLTPKGDRRLIRWFRTRVDERMSSRGAAILSSGEDVTEQHEVEERLRFESFLLDSVNDSIIIHDGAGHILYANEAACALRGFTREELLAKDFATLIAPEYVGQTRKFREELEANGHAVFETGHIGADGSTIVLEVHSRLIDYQGRRALLSVGRDVSERIAAQAEIRRLAHFDPVTGLPNRSLFSDRLNVAMLGAERRNESVALLFLDLDGFKAVNDTLGHAAGDKLLCAVGTRIQEQVRATDTVSRFGGDEFTILLVGLNSAEAARHVAENILESLRSPLCIEESEIVVRASIGISLYRPGAMSADELLAEADEALYAAKQAGRDRVMMHASSA